MCKSLPFAANICIELLYKCNTEQCLSIVNEEIAWVLSLSNFLSIHPKLNSWLQ